MRSLVGREPEMAAIESHIAADRSLILAGEAGIGKSALIAHAALACGRPVRAGGALSTLADVPYLALERALDRRLLGDGPAVVATVADAVGDGLLVVDDLQWADPFTLAALELLFDRVTVLAAVRYGERGSDRAFGMAKYAEVDVLDIGPLPDAAATALVGTVRPDLSSTDRRRFAELGGNNPFLLRELAETGETSGSLRRAVAARLHPLDPAARHALQVVAVAGAPLPRGGFGPEIESLLAARLVIDDGRGSVTVRHRLLADTVRDELDDQTVRTVHAELARLVDDPGEAAAHHLRAGEPGLAGRRALAAVEGERPGSARRAALLQLAALAAVGPDADGLRLLAAAEALSTRELHAGFDDLLDAVSGDDAATRGTVAAMRAWSRSLRGDVDGMRQWVQRGLDLVRGDDSPTEVQLLALAAGAASNVGARGAEASVLAERALAVARRIGAHEALARSAVARAHHLTGAPAWERELVAAIDLARQDGDVGVELTATQNMVTILIGDGDTGAAAAWAHRAQARARQLRLGAWEHHFRQLSLEIDVHAGRYGAAVDAGYDLLGRPADDRTAERGAQLLVLALVDLGRFDEARRLLGEWAPRATPGKHGRFWFDAFGAELELWSGRPAAAIATADRALEWAEHDDGDAAWPLIARGWACLDVARPLDTRVAADGGQPIMRGAVHESRAQHRLAAADHQGAADEFGAAIAAWQGRHVRGALRTSWGRGEALRLAGSRDAAVDQLLAAELAARDHGAIGVLRRIHRSLRLLGVRRSAPRASSPDGVTTREREIVRLASDGLTNVEIGRRLGVSRSTVAAQIASASMKVGASTRAQLVDRVET